MVRLLLLFSVAFATRVCGQAPDSPPPSPRPLPQLVKDAEFIVQLEVEKSDPKQRILTFKVAAVLKGKPDRRFEIQELSSLYYCQDTAPIFRWAKPGRKALGVQYYSDVLVCLGNFWYSLQSGETSWRGYMALPEWAETFVGDIEVLLRATRALLAGKPTQLTAQAEYGHDPFADIAPALPDDWLRGVKGRVWRLRLTPEPPTENVLDPPTFSPPQLVGWGKGEAEAVPPLVAALKDHDPLLRCEAVLDLEQLGRHAHAALPALRDALHDADGFVRLHAASALATLEPKGTVDLSPFLTALRGNDTALSVASLRALGNLGARGRSALPQLLKQLDHQEESVRAASAWAIGAIGLGTETALADRIACAEALGKGLKPVRHYLDEGQRAKLFTLRRLGADAWPAVPALVELLGDVEPHYHREPGEILCRLEPCATQVLIQSGTVPLLHSLEPLSENGALAWLAFPALVESMPTISEESWPTFGIMGALLQIDRQRAVPLVDARLLRHALDENSNFAATAVDLLPQLAPHSQTVRNAYRKALDSPNHFERECAVVALRETSTQRDYLELVSARVKSNNFYDRWGAIFELTHLGSKARPALPVLREAHRTATGDDRIVLRASHALIAGEATPRQQALRHLFDVAAKPRPFAKWVNREVRLGGAIRHYFGREALRLLPTLLHAEKPTDELERQLASSDLFARHAAALTLCDLNPQHDAARKVLLQSLADCPALLPTAVETLVALGPDSPEVFSLLRQVLVGADGVASLEARRYLRQHAPGVLNAVWGSGGLRRAGLRLNLTGTQLVERCDWLHGANALQAYRAQWELALEGERSVALLEKRLRPVPTRNGEYMTRLIADLDSRRFEVRRRAAEELEWLDVQAETHLRLALAERPALESRRRLEQIQARLEPMRSLEKLHALRGVEVLEQIASPAAQRLLRRLADGDDKATLTVQARAALSRLERSNSQRPLKPEGRPATP